MREVVDLFCAKAFDLAFLVWSSFFWKGEIEKNKKTILLWLALPWRVLTRKPRWLSSDIRCRHAHAAVLTFVIVRRISQVHSHSSYTCTVKGPLHSVQIFTRGPSHPNHHKLTDTHRLTFLQKNKWYCG